MKIYDISQEVFSSTIYPGDTSPGFNKLSDMENGDQYNLTEFHMCAHNGTHLDAPSHFIKDGKTVKAIDLSDVIGSCYVTDTAGILDGVEAKRILDNAR